MEFNDRNTVLLPFVGRQDRFDAGTEGMVGPGQFLSPERAFANDIDAPVRWCEDIWAVGLITCLLLSLKSSPLISSPSPDAM